MIHDTWDRLFEMIQRLFSIPHNLAQPLDMHAEMVETFQMISKSQTLVPIMMPVEILDRLIRHGPVPACHGEIVTEPGSKDDDMDKSCVEIHGNEGWMGKYERMSEANEWVEDVINKDISGNK